MSSYWLLIQTNSPSKSKSINTVDDRLVTWIVKRPPSPWKTSIQWTITQSRYELQINENNTPTPTCFNSFQHISTHFNPTKTHNLTHNLTQLSTSTCHHQQLGPRSSWWTRGSARWHGPAVGWSPCRCGWWCHDGWCFEMMELWWLSYDIMAIYWWCLMIYDDKLWW